MGPITGGRFGRWDRSSLWMASRPSPGSASPDPLCTSRLAGGMPTGGESAPPITNDDGRGSSNAGAITPRPRSQATETCSSAGAAAPSLESLPEWVPASRDGKSWKPWSSAPANGGGRNPLETDLVPKTETMSKVLLRGYPAKPGHATKPKKDAERTKTWVQGGNSLVGAGRSPARGWNPRTTYG